MIRWKLCYFLFLFLLILKVETQKKESCHDKILSVAINLCSYIINLTKKPNNKRTTVIIAIRKVRAAFGEIKSAAALFIQTPFFLTRYKVKADADVRKTQRVSRLRCVCGTLLTLPPQFVYMRGKKNTQKLLLSRTDPQLSPIALRLQSDASHTSVSAPFKVKIWS